MAIPDFQTVMLPLLEEVNNGAQHIVDLVAKISSKFNLSDEEKSERIPSGKISKISSRTQWAGTYLFKAGLLQRPKRGYLEITERGKEVLTKKPPKIDIRFLEQFEQFIKFREINRSSEADVENEHIISNTTKTPEDIIDDAFKKIESQTRDEILDMILKSTPQFFERLILDLFQAMGYGSRGKSEHVGKSGDGGIDGIINEDKLGLDKVYLQAKRYAPENKVPIDQIRSFAGSLDEKGSRKGIFVTTSSFVSSAYEYAERSPKSIVLIDGEELTRLMYEYDVGVRTVQTINLKRPDIDYFEDI